MAGNWIRRVTPSPRVIPLSPEGREWLATARVAPTPRLRGRHVLA